MIKNGEFREDLYYRLNVISILLPGLRERPDDIPLLISHFLKEKINPRSGQPYQVTRHAMDVLAAHDWLGNVRELENAIERATALCEDDTVRVRDLPPVLQKKALELASDDTVILANNPAVSPENADIDEEKVAANSLYPLENSEGRSVKPTSAPGAVSTSTPLGPLKNFIREQEAAYIQRILALTGNDKDKAAETLGVSLATLYRKLTDED